MQLPGEEDADGAVDMEGEAKKLGVVQLVFEVYTQTWGEPFNRPFVLVRRLKRANRGAGGRTRYEACEKRAAGNYKGELPGHFSAGKQAERYEIPPPRPG